MQQRAVNAMFFARFFFFPILSQEFVAISYVGDSPRIFRNKRLDDKNPEIIRDPHFARVSLILALVLSCTTSCVYIVRTYLDRTWCHVHTSSSDKNRRRGWRTFCPSTEGFVHGLTSESGGSSEMKNDILQPLHRYIYSVYAHRGFYIYDFGTFIMDDHYAICAVTKQDERISAERQEMIKCYNNDNGGWLNILLKYLNGDIADTRARAANSDERVVKFNIWYH